MSSLQHKALIPCHELLRRPLNGSCNSWMQVHFQCASAPDMMDTRTVSMITAKLPHPMDCSYGGGRPKKGADPSGFLIYIMPYTDSRFSARVPMDKVNAYERHCHLQNFRASSSLFSWQVGATSDDIESRILFSRDLSWQT